MNLTLKPCPFCGYQLPLEEGLCDAVFDEETGAMEHPFLICCSNCACAGSPGATKEEAIEAWNKRT